MDNHNIQLSYYNNRRNEFTGVKLDKPLIEYSDDELSTLIDNADSLSVFTDDESEVPALMEQMSAFREHLEWKGDITSKVCKPHTANGKEIIGRIRVGFNRDVSRTIGFNALFKRVAGMAR